MSQETDNLWEMATSYENTKEYNLKREAARKRLIELGEEVPEYWKKERE